VSIRAAFVVFVLYLQHVFNVNSGIRAIIKNANNHVGKLRRDPFGLFALRGTTGVRIFRIVRAASAMRSSSVASTMFLSTEARFAWA
jgi:hypothetical protein